MSSIDAFIHRAHRSVMANTDFHLQFQGESLKNLFERKKIPFKNKKDHEICLLVLEKILSVLC